MIPIATMRPATPASDSEKPEYLLSITTDRYDSRAAMIRLETDTRPSPR